MASNKEGLNQIHRVIDQITSASHKLVTATGTNNVSTSVYDRLKEATAKFEEHWAIGKEDGWKDEAQENGCASEQVASVDLECYSTVDELVALGPETLLEALRLKTRTADYQNDDAKQIALMERYIEMLSEILLEEIMQAKQKAEKKQAPQLYEEDIDAEGEDEEASVFESDDEDNQRIYNPSDLPIGSDGKPVPYWLYKLHLLVQSGNQF